MFHRATVFLVLVIVLAVASLPCCHAGRDRKRSTLARQITRQHSLGSLGYRDHEKAADSLSTRRVDNRVELEQRAKRIMSFDKTSSQHTGLMRGNGWKSSIRANVPPRG